MGFSIRTGNEFVRAEDQTYEGVLVKSVSVRRQALLRVKDRPKADELFSKLPTNAVVSGNGTEILQDKMGEVR